MKFRSYWAGCWAWLLVTSSVLETPASQRNMAASSWWLELCSSLEGAGRQSGRQSGRQTVVADSSTDASSLCPDLSFLLILDGDNKAVQHSVSACTGEQAHSHSQRFLLGFLNESTCCPLFPRRGQVFLVCKEGKVFFF